MTTEQGILRRFGVVFFGAVQQPFFNKRITLIGIGIIMKEPPLVRCLWPSLGSVNMEQNGATH